MSTSVGFLLFSCVCGCLYVSMHMDTHADVKPEVNIWCLPLSLSTLSCETGCLTEPAAHGLVRLPAQQAPGFFCLHILGAGIRGVCCYTELFPEGVWNLNSDGLHFTDCCSLVLLPLLYSLLSSFISLDLFFWMTAGKG